MMALFVHALLVIALTAGIHWRADENYSVEAELWAAVPVAAAPPLVETPPEPAPEPTPPPKAEVKPPPPPPAPSKDADIAIAKRKKLEAEQKLKDAEKLRIEQEKEAEEKKAKKRAEEKAAEEKRKQDLKDKALKDKAQKEKELKDKEAQKLKDQKAAQQAADEAQKLEALRKENMKRIAGLAGATGDSNATGNALHSAGPSDSYGGRIQTLLYPKITFSGDATPYIVDVEVQCAPNGTIIGTPKISKPSANPAWDDAVVKAFIKLETLPRDKDGRVPCPLVIGVRQRAP
jgi:colicin import membrane protein